MNHLLELLVLLWSSGVDAKGIHNLAGSACETAKSDIVMLVDGSDSIAQADFETIKSVLSEIVEKFHIGPNNVQIALVQFSSTTRIEWHLNTFTNKQYLLQAIAAVQQLAGGKQTGKALKHILHNTFKPTVGMRPHSTKIAVLISKGGSEDSMRLPAKNLRDTGIYVVPIGVGRSFLLGRYELDLHLHGGLILHPVTSFHKLPGIVEVVMVYACQSATNLDSVRLVNGSSLCSGRLDVQYSLSNKSSHIWSSVCEADFDQQDAEVVCKQLGCGPPSVIRGALYGEMEAPTWTAEFHCGGTESALLDCRTSGSARNTCSPGKTVGLTCSEPARLMGGATQCEGTLEVKRTEWRPVKGSDWFLKEAAAVCGQIKCGSAVSVEIHKTSSVKSVWWISSDCVQSGYPLKECASADSSSFILNITCSDSVRLVNGFNLCSGRLEVKSSQSNETSQIWSPVCEDDFDQHNAEVVCRELGCGPPSVLQGELYRKEKDPTWTTKFQCEGTESTLLYCKRSGSARNMCSSGKAVGVICSQPVRLVGGASRCEGTLEVRVETWRPVDASGWSMQEAAAACRELNCGSVISVGSRNDSSVRRAWKIKHSCFQSRSPLRECASSSFEFCPILELVCTDLLVQPIISVSSKDGVIHALQQRSAGVFQGSNFIIICSIQSQYPGGSFQLYFTSSSKTQSYTQPAINHSAHFPFPATEPAHRGSYSCVYSVHVFYHNFSSESRLLTLTVLDPTIFTIRLVVLPLSLLSFICLIYCTCKTTRRWHSIPQKNMELDHYHQGVGGDEAPEVEEDQVQAALHVEENVN